MSSKEFSKKISSFQALIQFSRFFIVGIINTGVDLAVLNILIWIAGGVRSDSEYSFFKALSFIAAVVNSYYFNKYWVFADSRKSISIHKERMLFFAVSVCGFILNVVSAFIVFHLINNLYSQNIYIASNIGAIAGTVIVIFFNFIGYKLIVFK